MSMRFVPFRALALDRPSAGPEGGDMTTALITGATAGIGLSFAKLLAAEGSDLVLVARDRERLDALASRLREQHGIAVEVLPADLTIRADSERVEARLADSGQPIDLLVNNAGFGLNAFFGESTIDDEQRLLDILVTAVMRLSHAAVPGMVQRGRGQIINVSSVAAWMYGGTYSAAKAWCTVFSESLHRELSGTGVTVAAVAPGFTHTEFHQRASMDMNGMREWMWLDSDAVASDALRAVRRGRPLAVPGTQYKVASALLQYLPRPIVRAASGSRPNERNRRKRAD